VKTMCKYNLTLNHPHKTYAPPMWHTTKSAPTDTVYMTVFFIAAINAYTTAVPTVLGTSLVSLFNFQVYSIWWL